MRILRDHRWLLIIGAIVLFLFRSWFRHGIISGSDFTYIYPSQFNEFALQPYAWSGIFGNGLGGVTLNILNLDFYLHGLGGALVNFLDMSWDAAYRLLFFWPFLLIGFFGAYALGKSVIRHAGYAAISPLIYLVNTYILMIVGGGQVGLMMAYAVAPYVLSSYIQRKQYLFLAASALLVLFDLRFSVLVFAAVVLYTVFVIPNKQWGQAMRFILLPAIVVICLHGFWLIPSLVSRTLVVPEGYDDPGWLSFLSWADFPKTISLLHPNWPENIFGKISFMKPEFLLLPVVVFLPLTGSDKEKGERRTSYHFFLLLLLVSAFLAKGVHPPLGNVYEWLFVHAPLFSGFRDPTKFYLLSSLAYAVLIPYAIAWAGNFTRVKRIRHKENILMVLAVLLWGAVMFPFVAGKLGGTFGQTVISEEYRQYEQLGANSKEFQRTLVIPWKNRFVYNTTRMPAMDASAVFATRDISVITDKMSDPRLTDMLARFAVRYVIVPEDTTEEIFLTDRKYDRRVRDNVIQSLDKLPYLKKRTDFRTLAVYEVEKNNGHFFIEGVQRTVIPVVSTQQHPAKYDVLLPASSDKQTLVFSERFNPRWQLWDGEKTVQSYSTSDGLNSFSILPGKKRAVEVTFSLQDDIYRWQNFSFFIFVLCLAVVVLRGVRKTGLRVRTLVNILTGLMVLGILATGVSSWSHRLLVWSDDWVRMHNPSNGRTFFQSSVEGSSLSWRVVGASSVTLTVSGIDSIQAVGLQVRVNGQPVALPRQGERPVERIVIRGPVTGFAAEVRTVCSGAPDCLLTVREVALPLGGVFVPVKRTAVRSLALLGDSISGMHGVNGYGYKVADTLDLDFRNASVIGSTLTETNGYQPGVRRFERDISPYKPDILVIALGANDILRGVSAGEFAGEYSRLVRHIRATLPGTAVILLGVFPQAVAADPDVRSYNDRIREIADTFGVSYVDPTLFVPRSLYQDQIHPGVDAQQRIADAIIRVIQEEVSRE